jgi:hypothetical protein
MQQILFAGEWDCAKRLTFKIMTSEIQIETTTLELGRHQKKSRPKPREVAPSRDEARRRIAANIKAKDEPLRSARLKAAGRQDARSTSTTLSG